MKYKVLRNFTDKYDESIEYKINDIVVFTEERANEILRVGDLIEKQKEEQIDKEVNLKVEKKAKKRK